LLAALKAFSVLYQRPLRFSDSRRGIESRGGLHLDGLRTNFFSSSRRNLTALL
jgi:hypothetical protein